MRRRGDESARSWPHRDVLPSFRKLAAAFAAVGLPIVSRPAKSFWRLTDRDVRENIRTFQRTCAAVQVGQLHPTGELDEPTMATLFYLLSREHESARALFEE